MQFVSVCMFVCLIGISEAWFNVYPRTVSTVGDIEEVGDALFLTPYIERGDIQGGQSAALVKNLDDKIVSYSGFVTVDRRYNSNMFFWFFPAEYNNESAPLVIWLQGGPGASSMFGLFEENGPFFINSILNLEKRDYYWTKYMNVLYIDSPVGTGFSFTEHEDGYARDQNDVGQNLYSTVQQFLQLFPQYRKNDLFVTGESYAGKYVPALAHTIDFYNDLNREKINLKGISIGNGLCDPATMLTYADYLYQIGLIDINTKTEMKKLEKVAKDLINMEQYELASEVFDEIILGDLQSGPSMFRNQSGFSTYFNYLQYKDESVHGDIGRYFDQAFVRLNLHVGNLTYYSVARKVEELLKADISKSIKPWFEKLMEKYRVVVYNGQLDIIVAYPLTMNFVQSLQWSGAEEYKTAERKQWFVDGELAGYTKTVGKFTEILVRNAGHMVPSDQPKWALDLIHHVTRFIPF